MRSLRPWIEKLAAISFVLGLFGTLITSLGLAPSAGEDATLLFAITTPLWAIAYLLASVEREGDADAH